MAVKKARCSRLHPRTMTSAHLNEHGWLVVGVGGEDLLLLGGDGGVPLDEGGHDTASGLQTQGQWGHIQQEQVLNLLVCLSAQNGCLHIKLDMFVMGPDQLVHKDDQVLQISKAPHVNIYSVSHMMLAGLWIPTGTPAFPDWDRHTEHTWLSAVINDNEQVTNKAEPQDDSRTHRQGPAAHYCTPSLVIHSERTSVSDTIRGGPHAPIWTPFQLKSWNG